MRIISVAVLLVVIFVLTSCDPKKRIVYFQGDAHEQVLGHSNYIPTFKVDDFVTVMVSCDDPEQAEIFNFPQGVLPGGGRMGGGGGGYESGIARPNAYLVDYEGNVDLPIVGKIHFAGKTQIEMVNKLKEVYEEYLNNPTVIIQVVNYRVTVLGDVRRPGAFNIPYEKISIIEILGIAGDLNITANRKNVLVVRDTDGVKTEYRIDLTSKEVFNSPVYFLEQNDVVYVEPSVVSRTQATIWRTSGSIIISITSFALTTTLLILSRI